MAARTRSPRLSWQRCKKLAVLAIIIGLPLISMGGLFVQAAPSVSGSNRYGMALGCCFVMLSPTEQVRQLEDLQTMGVAWVRIDMYWSAVQYGGPVSWDWAQYDAAISRIQAHGIKVLPILAYAPTWARDGSCAQDQMCRPRDPAEFGRFANAAAARYAPVGVHAWEVWNEPNNAKFFAPRPDPGAYTALLRSAATGIRRADSAATVISGGLSPAASDGQDVAPVRFLEMMYANGAKSSFDALGHHPYCFDGPTYSCPVIGGITDAWSEMAGSAPSLRSTMIANGDAGKQIWATEFGAPTAGSPKAVPQQLQAQMLTRAYALFAQQPWAGPLFTYTYKDRGTNQGDVEDWFGLVTASNARKPAYDAYRASALRYRAASAVAQPTPRPASSAAATAKPITAPVQIPAPGTPGVATVKPAVNKQASSEALLPKPAANRGMRIRYFLDGKPVASRVFDTRRLADGIHRFEEVVTAPDHGVTRRVSSIVVNNRHSAMKNLVLKDEGRLTVAAYGSLVAAAAIGLMCFGPSTLRRRLWPRMAEDIKGDTRRD